MSDDLSWFRKEQKVFLPIIVHCPWSYKSRDRLRLEEWSGFFTDQFYTPETWKVVLLKKFLCDNCFSYWILEQNYHEIHHRGIRYHGCWIAKQNETGRAQHNAIGSFQKLLQRFLSILFSVQFKLFYPYSGTNEIVLFCSLI